MMSQQTLKFQVLPIVFSLMVAVKRPASKQAPAVGVLVAPRDMRSLYRLFVGEVLL
jgi:hypothetical protein